MSNHVTYTVETSYPYEFTNFTDLTEAKRKVAEYKRNGRYAVIVVSDVRGNDYILAD